MISMFDLKNSKKNMTQICVYYCYKLLESSMCPFQSRLHLCICMRCSMCHLTHIIRQDYGMFFCYACNITTPPYLVFWRWMWNIRLCLTKTTTHHILMSPLKKDWISTFDRFRWGDVFIHALWKNKLILSICWRPFKFVVSFFLTPTDDLTCFQEYIAHKFYCINFQIKATNLFNCFNESVFFGWIITSMSIYVQIDIHV
jgi:hypothetical protein